MPDRPGTPDETNDPGPAGESSAPAQGNGDSRLMDARLDDLLDLMEVDSDALREAEFEQIQSILDTMTGKTIQSASIESTRIVVETTDGNRYFFFGFMSRLGA